MFLLAVGASLPFLLTGLTPLPAVILYALMTAELIWEALRPLPAEGEEALASPTKLAALVLVIAATVALLVSWPQEVRRTATLLMLSGVCLFWGYRHGRSAGPWKLAAPCLVVSCLLLTVYLAGYLRAYRFLEPARLSTAALVPPALVWSLAVTTSFWPAVGWIAAGVIYLAMLFLLSDWTAIIAFGLVVLIALAAIRRDSDVPFSAMVAGIAVWLVECLLFLLPACSSLGWFPKWPVQQGARALLAAQSGIESFIGSHTWAQIWAATRTAHRPALESDIAWQEYLQAEVVGMSWLSAPMLAALLIVLFLLCAPSRRSRSSSQPLLSWRLLAVVAWVAVSAPTALCITSPVVWLLMGGLIGLKELHPAREEMPWEETRSAPVSLAPALMAALFVVPLVQSAREWRAEQLARVDGEAVSAARWAPWRSDIVASALEAQLQAEVSDRDNAAIQLLLAWLKRSGREAVAYDAQASLEAVGGGSPVVALSSAVRASPQDLRLRRRYADALKAAGFLEEARRQYEVCANLSPSDPSLRIAIGSLWELTGREELALAEYRKALVLDPESKIARLKIKELAGRVGQ